MGLVAPFSFVIWAAAYALETKSPLEGLSIKVIKEAKECNLKSMEKDFVEMHYVTKIAESSKTGKLGQQVDQSRDEDGMNDPLSFQLGSSRVVDGWDKGVRDMCEGEIRLLTIPPEHAYGDEGLSKQKSKFADSDNAEIEIPSGATIAIEAELIRIIRLQEETTVKAKSCKRQAEIGDMLKVHYTLWIHPTSLSGEKGERVESSHDSSPMEFQLGAGRVIPGWDQALEGTCAGEELELIVPPEFAYGEKGSGQTVPPMATLWFKVEVLEVTETNLFQQIDANNDHKISVEELGTWMEKAQGEKDPEVIKSIFDGEDKNKDGFIDWDEAPFPKGEKPQSDKTSEL